MGFAIVSWTAADIVWNTVYADDPNAPYPSSADALWLVFYPASCVVLVAAGPLAAAQGAHEPVARRPDRRRSPRSPWRPPSAYGPVVHEGGAGDLSAAGPDQPGLPGRRPAAARRGGGDLRPDRLAPGRGVARARPRARAQRASATASTWSRRRRAPTSRARFVDALWPASALLVGLSAWQPAKRDRAPERSEPAPGAGAGGLRPGRASVLLAYDHFARLNGLTLALTAADAAARAGAHRAACSPRTSACWLASREEARTDPLTGLAQPAQPDGRPRARSWPQATPERPRGAGAVRPRRLQGVQRRLRPPGRRRAAGAARASGSPTPCTATAAPTGSAATSSASLLQPGPGRASSVLADACVAALAEHGEGFDVTTSHGAVRGAAWRRAPRPRRSSWPTGACTPARATGACRPGASRATCCCAACPSASPTCTCTCADRPSWPSAVGRELGMHGRGARRGGARGRAARRRQDRHPGRDPREAGPARRDRVGLHAPPHDHRRAHPAGRARRCGRVARLVRSSHERWDGAGYPDGLARRGDPARRPRGRGLRRLRRDDHRPPLPRSASRRAGGARGAAPLRRHPVRPGRRRGLRRALERERGSAVAAVRRVRRG